MLEGLRWPSFSVSLLEMAFTGRPGMPAIGMGFPAETQLLWPSGQIPDLAAPVVDLHSTGCRSTRLKLPSSKEQHAAKNMLEAMA